MANLYPERIAAYAFLTVGYLPPSPEKFEAAKMGAWMKQTFGYELFGYQSFFVSDGADKIIEKHVRLPSCIFLTPENSRRTVGLVLQYCLLS